MAASPRINCASLGFWPLLQSRTFCSRLLCHLHRWWKSCLRSEDQELFQERLSEHQIQDNRVDHARTIYAENASLGRRPRFVAATTSSIKTLVPASKPHRGTKSAGIYIYIILYIYIIYYIYILYIIYYIYICKNVKTWTSSNVGTERLSSLHPQVTTCDHNWHGNGTEHWIKFVDKKRVYLSQKRMHMNQRVKDLRFQICNSLYSQMILWEIASWARDQRKPVMSDCQTKQIKIVPSSHCQAMSGHVRSCQVGLRRLLAISKTPIGPFQIIVLAWQESTGAGLQDMCRTCSTSPYSPYLNCFDSFGIG